MVPENLPEKLLQFIWLHKYYDASGLCTTDQQPLKVIHPGTWNQDQGPDFLNARLLINTTQWAGPVEIHLRSSDFMRHGHQNDERYRALILHVVYEEDQPLAEHYSFPVLVLGPRIAHSLLERYRQLLHQPQFVPCESFLPILDEFGWIHFQESLMAERMLRKTIEWLPLSRAQRWDELYWQMLATAMGGKVNGFLFGQMAAVISPAMLSRQRHHLPSLEALLLGQCGLLKDIQEEDAYLEILRKEYAVLKIKYRLPEPLQEASLLRMRPAGFPHLRLAQLAMMFHRHDHFFSRLRETTDLQMLKSVLQTEASEPWNTRYHFGAAGATAKKKTIGASMTDLLLINGVLPAIYLMADTRKDYAKCEQVLTWMQQLKPEKNKITHGFARRKVPVTSALSSQGLIELKTRYCDVVRCLECRAGYKLLRNTDSFRLL